MSNVESSVKHIVAVEIFDKIKNNPKILSPIKFMRDETLGDFLPHINWTVKVPPHKNCTFNSLDYHIYFYDDYCIFSIATIFYDQYDYCDPGFPDNLLARL